MYSHKNLPIHLSSKVPFDDDTQFVQFIKAKPFTIIYGGSVTEREQLAAAMLKRTFSFSPTRYGSTRARFGDAAIDLQEVRHKLYGQEAFDDLVAYRTYVMLEIGRVAQQDAEMFRQLMWKRQDHRTILTFGEFPELKNIDQSTLSLFATDTATHIYLG